MKTLPLRLSKLAFITVFILQPHKSIAESRFIVWNIGQGLWTSLQTPDRCLHFDAGGEFAPWKLIEEHCPHKNVLHFTHWDWDHIGFAKPMFQRFRATCIGQPPKGAGTEKKKKIFERFTKCEPQDSAPNVIEITWPHSGSHRHLSSNDESRVYIVRSMFLIPGDSTSRQEKIWAVSRDQSQSLSRIKTLILGHHGSRTSTSDTLLSRLPQARQAIASARAARYGHPHPTVVTRLKAHGISMIRTEDWGTIVFTLQPNSWKAGAFHKPEPKRQDKKQSD